CTVQEVHDASVLYPVVGLQHHLGVAVTCEGGAEQVIDVAVEHDLAPDDDVAVYPDLQDETRRIDLIGGPRRQVDLGTVLPLLLDLPDLSAEVTLPEELRVFEFLEVRA